MKKLSSVLAVLALVSFSSCMDTVPVKDGKVPAELLDAARLWTGTYSGNFDHEANDLSFALAGDRPMVGSTQDLIGAGCNSKVGALTEIAYDKDDAGAVLGRLTFDLDPGLCAGRVNARSITFTATMNGNKVESIFASYLRTIYLERHCEIDGGGPHHAPTVHCWNEAVPVYAQGRLYRNPQAE